MISTIQTPIPCPCDCGERVARELVEVRPLSMAQGGNKTLSVVLKRRYLDDAGIAHECRREVFANAARRNARRLRAAARDLARDASDYAISRAERRRVLRDRLKANDQAEVIQRLSEILGNRYRKRQPKTDPHSRSGARPRRMGEPR